MVDGDRPRNSFSLFRFAKTPPSGRLARLGTVLLPTDHEHDL